MKQMGDWTNEMSSSRNRIPQLTGKSRGSGEPRLWVFAILVIVIANLRLFYAGATVPFDAFDEMWLYFRWLGSALRQGFFPDFFPHIMAGYPIGSNIQAGTYNVFYLALAYAFPDSVLAINYVYLLTQFAIFWLGYEIARSFDLDPLSRLYLGLSLTASGFVIGHASHFSYLATAAGLLACFLALRRALSGRYLAAGSLAFLGVYHMLTAGYPANILFGAQCLLVYWAWQFVTVRTARRALLFAAAGAIAGLSVSYPSVWHFFNLLQLSPRGRGLDVETVLSGSLPAYGLISFFAPLWKMRMSEPTMERFHLLLVSGPLLLFALWYSIAAKKDRKRIAAWFALALLLVLLALGKNSPVPLRQWLAEHLFIYRTGRFPSGEHRGIAIFLLALITAFGLQWLIERRPQQRLLFAVVILVDFLLVTMVLRPMRHWVPPEEHRGKVAMFQARFDRASQGELDKARICTPEGPDWTFRAIEIQRDRLAPTGFYWNGYTSLRDEVYDRERNAVADVICGGPRLRRADDPAPLRYALTTYEPGSVKFTITDENLRNGDRVIWADYDDGFWTLKINGQAAALEPGPARLRTFSAKSGDEVEMTYAGPLSRWWR